MAAQPLIVCDGLFFTHKGAETPLLQDIHAELLAGQAVALHGPNGAGKSTLIALLLGLTKPAGGTVTVRGIAAHRLSWKHKARLFGYLPQQAELLLQAPTVAGELEFALRCQGQSADYIAAQVGPWLQRLGLEALAERCPQLLSRGEKQRLALGAVIIGAPEILILDEPFAGQDARQIDSVIGFCREFLRESPQRGLLFTTHDLDAAEGLFSAEWHLADGHLCAGACSYIDGASAGGEGAREKSVDGEAAGDESVDEESARLAVTGGRA